MRKINVFFQVVFFILLVSTTVYAETYTVTSREDSGTNTLRWAVQQANAMPDTDLIIFTVGTSITVYSQIDITDPVIISGQKTQVIGGGSGGINIFILQPNSDGSTITGVALVNASIAIEIISNCNRVYGCAIGTDWNDATDRLVGSLRITGDFNDIGGSSISERNIFATSSVGIHLFGAMRTTIRGNYIGLASDGETALGSAFSAGVCLNAAIQNMIGGNRNSGEGNVIRGDTGIDIANSSFGNTICGNIIGLNAAQNASLSITTGINIRQCNGNYIGLPMDEYGNVIAGYSDYGITGGGLDIIIQNNIIGISPTDADFGGGRGIWLSNADSCLIGGARNNGQYEKNIISFNSEGIYLYQCNNNTICGNYIGITIDGYSAAGNDWGIKINGYGNLIGGANITGGDWRGNIISGSSNGVYLDIGGGNTIVGNYIGLNGDGDAAIPNNQGIRINDPSAGNYIGLADPIYRNIISGNTTGIYLQSANNIIKGNYIGTNSAGTAMIKNVTNAIYIISGANTRIGGTTEAERNVICGGSFGIRFLDVDSGYIINNYIGVLPNLSPAGENFNTAAISIEGGSENNYIGHDTWSNSSNLIVGAATGIALSGATSDGNRLFGNTITSCTTAYISLAGDGANNNKPAPVIITPSDVALIQGTTTGADDYIEVFVSNRGAGVRGGSVRFVGSTTAVSGNWSLVPSGLTGGEYVCAIATDSSNNSSGFSLNQLVQVPTPTYTPTPGNTPTSTPTPTATPVFQAFVCSISPEYSHAKAQVSCTVRGESFFTPISVRLQGNGIAARYAANVVLLNSKVITCTFDLSGLAGGTYAVRVDSFGVYGVLNNGLKIINPIALPINWEVLDMGQAGTHAMANDTRGIYVGDGDNDTLQEVFSAGLLQNILKYDLTTMWSISALPAGTIGENYTGVITCDMDNDGLREVYGTTLDHYVYQFSGGDLATKTNISGDMGYEQYALVCGDGNNDHAFRDIYGSRGWQ